MAYRDLRGRRRGRLPVVLSTLKRTGGLALIAALPSAALAQTSDPPPGVCVVCTEPPAIYECVLPPKIQAQAGSHKLVRRGLQLACIQEISKVRGHAKCGARRGKSGPCTGLIHTLQGPFGRPAKSTASGDEPSKPKRELRDGSAPEGAERVRDKNAKADDAPPKTVKELADQATKKTGEQLDDAGKAIGDAARKSWSCLTSLFSDC